MIRSTIVLHDIDSGDEEVAFETDELIEAPNWSPDGAYLLLNGNGQLFRFNLGGTALIPIPTGRLTHLNNDHGISPDGMTYALSDNPGRGESRMFSMPAAGGPIFKAGQEPPAYWHGWSPDGKTWAYTARRGEHFQICTCPAEGGDETQLTYGPGHRDGPDFSHDGAWIWFNSDHHGGTPELWRMRLDGSGLQRMTEDARVNWFPHPSPDGRHVVYLSFGAHVSGHPRGEEVELRAMSPEGGAVRTIAAFHGGQGSINVPCWAPDGKRFAYVRYAGL